VSARVEGKVAFVTGAARGQGRSHAVRLAEEGADIIAVDVCEQIANLPYPTATEEDLAQTVKAVEAVGRRIVAAKADVRDFGLLKDVLDDGVRRLGRLDIVAANAGIMTEGTPAHLVTEEDWRDVIDVNLTGVWHTCKAAIPHLIGQGTGGSIVLTSSSAGLKGPPNVAAYSSSKHGLVGLMRTLTLELGEHMIRVNTVHPTGVPTDMIINQRFYELFLPGEEHPTKEMLTGLLAKMNVLPVPWVEPIDISNAVLFLASDEARYITGTEFKVDAGWTVKVP
jgi:SDR family mycofactocin-dependent oxidoreductase